MAKTKETKGEKVVEDSLSPLPVNGDPALELVGSEETVVKLPAQLRAGKRYFILVPYKDSEKISQEQIENEMDILARTEELLLRDRS